jgi:endonuclease/exonuclease/phosphatase (EEP) superfamily protein YafD
MPGRTRRLASLALAIAAAAAAAGALGALGRFAWWLELFSHFRLQYALTLAACAGLLLLLRRPVPALAALALALANALPLAHYLLPAQEPAVAGPRVKAVLVNTWFRNGEHARLLDYVGALGPDVAVFLEVTPEWSEALERLDSLPYRSLAGEILVASRQPLAGLKAWPLAGGAAMAVSFSYDAAGTPVTVIGAHASWPLGPEIATSRNQELVDLAAIARAAPQPVLLLGDLNTTAYSPFFDSLLTASGLRDCAAGRGLNPTWPALFPPLYIQIDHCLAGPGVRIDGLRAGPRVGSDHLPLEVEFTVVPQFRGGTGAITAATVPPTSRR